MPLVPPSAAPPPRNWACTTKPLARRLSALPKRYKKVAGMNPTDESSRGFVITALTAIVALLGLGVVLLVRS
jgi:hypothetical protein